MSRVKRTRRRLLLAGGIGVGLVLAAGDVALVTVGHAAQDDTLAPTYSVYNGEVASGADRETVTTENDVGLPGGAINNYYPDTRVGVAVAGTSAEASPADTGPLAQAVIGGQGQTQPQYVRASDPGTPNPPGYQAGPATAAASAGIASALATGTYGAVGTTATSPLGAPAEGSDGLTARSTSYFDSALGFVTTGDARVHHASYGGGMLVLDDVHVSVSVSNLGLGSFTKNISITVAGATVTANGTTVPVVIDQNGVTVAQQNAPIDQVQAVSQTLNAELAAAGISVHAVSPQITQQGPDVHIEAVGVVVTVRQVGTPEGVPKQSATHVLGDVVLDNEAVLAPALPELAPPPAPTEDTGPTDAGSTTTTIITNTGGTAPAPAPAPAAVAPPRATPVLYAAPTTAIVKQPHPGWLLFAYLAWQALLVALAGAVYLHRSALRRTP